jgi:hypothetical protein
MRRWFRSRSSGSDHSWPTRGVPATFFLCPACEERILVIYEPKSQMVPACSQRMTISPLPRGTSIRHHRGNHAFRSPPSTDSLTTENVWIPDRADLSLDPIVTYAIMARR